jgi:hypothetical protein
VADAAELLREQRYQREQRTLGDSTPLARDAAEAYREVMGERQRAADTATRRAGGNSFL